MASDLATLNARREALLRRSAALRSSLAGDATAVTDHLHVVETVTAFLRSGRGRMLVWAGTMLLLLAGPRGTLRVAGRGAIIWSLVRRLLPGAAHSRRSHRV
jgi:hypothetical protein